MYLLKILPRHPPRYVGRRQNIPKENYSQWFHRYLNQRPLEFKSKALSLYQSTRKYWQIGKILKLNMDPWGLSAVRDEETTRRILECKT